MIIIIYHIIIYHDDDVDDVDDIIETTICVNWANSRRSKMATVQRGTCRKRNNVERYKTFAV